MIYLLLLLYYVYYDNNYDGPSMKEIRNYPFVYNGDSSLRVTEVYSLHFAVVRAYSIVRETLGQVEVVIHVHLVCESEVASVHRGEPLTEFRVRVEELSK